MSELHTLFTKTEIDYLNSFLKEEEDFDITVARFAYLYKMFLMDRRMKMSVESFNNISTINQKIVKEKTVSSNQEELMTLSYDILSSIDKLNPIKEKNPQSFLSRIFGKKEG